MNSFNELGQIWNNISTNHSGRLQFFSVIYFPFHLY